MPCRICEIVEHRQISRSLLEKPAHLSLDTSAGGRKGHAGHERCAKGAKEESSGAESEKGIDRENREEMREEVPVKKRGSRTWQKQQKIRQSNSASQPCAPCSRPGLAASPLRARAFPPARCPVVCELFLFLSPHSLSLLILFHFVSLFRDTAHNSHSLQRQACPAPGCSASPCYASLLSERQQARAEAHRARGSQAAKPCVCSEMGCCRTLPECVVSQLCSTACNISQQCCAYLLGQQQLFQSRPRRETSGAGSPKASSQQPQRQKLTTITTPQVCVGG